MIRLFLLMAAILAGCASVRPQVGAGWEYTAKPVAPDTFKIHVKESRFASTEEVESLFRVAAGKVAELNHCRDYKITAYSPYLENAFIWASIPVIDGEIICLH